MLEAEGSGICAVCTCTDFVFYCLCDSFPQEVDGSKFNCKEARFSPVVGTYSQARSSDEFIIRKLNPLVVVHFRFISAFLHA